MSKPAIVTTRKPINHLREGILTVLTAGLWGFVWGWKVFYRTFDR